MTESRPSEPSAHPAASDGSASDGSHLHGLDVAATRWTDFPVASTPRALVLTGPAVGLGTISDPAAHEALAAGRVTADESLPADALEAIRRAGLLRSTGPDSVRFVSAVPTSMGFSTDRGGRQLGAWLLSIGGVGGTCYVMDAASQALTYPLNSRITVSHPLGGYAKLLGDGLTVRVDFDPPWLTRDEPGASSAVAVVETDTSVVFAPTVDQETGSKDPAAPSGPRPAVTFRLLQPLGGRVLCDVGGSPVIVARRKRNGR